MRERQNGKCPPMVGYGIMVQKVVFTYDESIPKVRKAQISVEVAFVIAPNSKCPIRLKELRCNIVIVRGHLPKCLSEENKHKYTRVHDIQIARKVVKGCGRT